MPSPVSVVALLMLIGCLALSSCKSAGDFRHDADRVAYQIIKDKQKEATGHTEPFTIAQPADTLRKRLLIGQDLPFVGPASLGTHALSPIPHWPNDPYLKQALPDEKPLLTVTKGSPLKLTLTQALEVAARASRDYQTHKEAVFEAALDLDLQRDEFRSTFAGVLTGEGIDDLSTDPHTGGVVSTVTGSVVQRLKNGATLTARIGLDLVNLLTQEHASSMGLFGDASISIPLLRGAGRYIVAEPLTQAERNALYAIYRFERFKRTFAVEIASDYLGVLQGHDQIDNAEQSYQRLLAAAKREQRFADAGRVPQIDVDQAVQQTLVARDRWISAKQSYANRLDGFKLTLGLPVDADIELDHDVLTDLAQRLKKVLGTIPMPKVAPSSEERTNVPLMQVPTQVPPEPTPPGQTVPSQPPFQTPAEQKGGPLEIPAPKAIHLALAHRLDLRIAEGGVYDAQRKVVVAADALQAELTLLGTVSTGEERSLATADLPDSTRLPLDHASYNALLTLDLPLERTQERNRYRKSLIDLEQATRDVQQTEDQVKLDVRSDLRELASSRETVRIQTQAVQLAKRRVDSTDLFLQAGRAEIRDVLEAQESLISAQNGLTAALIDYRLAELELQRDMGLLEVSNTGLWQEYKPSK